MQCISSVYKMLSTTDNLYGSSMTHLWTNILQTGIIRFWFLTKIYTCWWFLPYAAERYYCLLLYRLPFTISNFWISVVHVSPRCCCAKNPQLSRVFGQISCVTISTLIFYCFEQCVFIWGRQAASLSERRRYYDIGSSSSEPKMEETNPPIFNLQLQR